MRKSLKSQKEILARLTTLYEQVSDLKTSMSEANRFIYCTTGDDKAARPSGKRDIDRVLRETYEQFLRVLNSLDIGVYVADMQNYEILFVNEHNRKIFGEDVVGKKCWEVFQSGRSGPCDFCTNDKLLNADGEPVGTIVWEFENTRTGTWCTIRDRAIKWVDGRLVRLEIASDITKLKRTENELRSAQAELERRVEERTADLRLANEQLQRTVDEYRRVEDALKASESRYRAIVEDQTELVVRCLPDLTLSFANSAYCRYFGESRDEVMGKGFWHHLPEEEHERVKEHFGSLDWEHPVKSIEHQVVTKDGDIRWQQWTDRAIFDESGNLIEFQSVGRDTTERNRMENALRSSERQFRKLVETMNEGLAECDHDDRLTYVNDKLCAMLGYSHDELLGRSMRSLYFDDERFTEDAERIRRSGGRSLSYEAELKRRDGRKVFAIISSSSILDETGRFKEMILAITDVSELKRAERALRESEEKHRAIFEQSPMGIIQFDRDGIIKACNDAMLRIMGFEREHVLGLNLLQYLRNEEVKAAIRTCLSGSLAHFKGLYTSIISNKTIYVKADYAPMFSENGTILGGVGIIEDISERQNAEEKLRSSEERLRVLFESAPDAYFLVDLEGNFVDGNRAAEEISGYRIAELKGKNFMALGLLSHDQEKRALDILRSAGVGERSGPYEFSFHRKDGKQVWVEVRSLPTVIEGRGLMLCIARDITERKLAEISLEQSQKQMRMLSSKLLVAQEEERKRIAREVHDSIGSYLTGIKINLENTLTAMEKGTATAESIRPIVSMCRQTIRECRRIMTDLRPSILDDYGIAATIGWLCNQFASMHSGIIIRKEIDVSEDRLPEALKTTIFRVLQEALNNIVKHSRARHVTVSLTQTRRDIGFTVEDDGMGFVISEMLAKQNHSRGLGLTSMKERVELSGGIFSIHSVKGKGTRIRAFWPHPEKGN